MVCWIKAFGGLQQFKDCATENKSAVIGLHRLQNYMIDLGTRLNPTIAAA